jgi:hypothetical protein
MARPPVLPKLAIPSLAPPTGATRPGTTEKQPLTALERGRAMQVPPTPVVVPPTPVGGQTNSQDAENPIGGENSGASPKEGDVAHHGEAADVPDAEDVMIAESPEEDAEIDGWPTVGSSSGTTANNSISVDRKNSTTSTSNGEKNRSEVEKKGSVPTGRSRSRSGSSSSQCTSVSEYKKCRLFPSLRFRNGTAADKGKEKRCNTDKGRIGGGRAFRE